ncbi:MAG: hypothetical protein WDZ49_04245 [Litorilinea sp.]
MTTPTDGQSTGPENTQWESTQAGSTQSETGSSETGRAPNAQSQALIDELNSLGAKFAEAIDAAWKSEQRKRLEDDLRTGVTDVAESLEQHLKEFSQREETRKMLDRAEDVADKMRTSKVSQEIAAALTQGLRTLSDKLDKLAHDLRERDNAAKTAGTPPQPATDDAATSDATAGKTPTTDTNGGDSQDIPIARA